MWREGSCLKINRCVKTHEIDGILCGYSIGKLPFMILMKHYVLIESEPFMVIYNIMQSSAKLEG